MTMKEEKGMIKEKMRNLVILIMMCCLCFMRTLMIFIGVIFCFHLAVNMRENEEIFFLFVFWTLAIILFVLCLFFFGRDFENFREFCESFFEDTKREEKRKQVAKIREILNENFKLVRYNPKEGSDVILDFFWNAIVKENVISLYARIDEENYICYIFTDGKGNLIAGELKSDDYTFFLENIHV